MRWCSRSARRSRARNNTVIVATGSILGVDAGAGQEPRHAADQHDGGRHLGRHACRSAFSPSAMAGAPPTSSASACGALAGPDRIRRDHARRASGCYLLATFFGGLYAASHMSYRFGAADTASPEFKPKAVAWVMAGGLFAAILGPQLVIFTKDLMPPYLFAGELSRAGAVRRHGRAHHPDVLPRAGPGRSFGSAKARPAARARSRASRNSSSRWCAGSRATR